MKLPFEINLNGKIAVVTGAGGVLMSEFAKALAACGAKVALLDINAEAAEAVASAIGENALAIPTNCLDKAEIQKAAEIIHGKCRFRQYRCRPRQPHRQPHPDTSAQQP